MVLDYDQEGRLVGIDLQHARQKFDIEALQIQSLPFSQVRAVA